MNKFASIVLMRYTSYKNKIQNPIILINSNNCQNNCDTDFSRLIDKNDNFYEGLSIVTDLFIEQFSDIDFYLLPTAGNSRAI